MIDREIVYGRLGSLAPWAFVAGVVAVCTAAFGSDVAFVAAGAVGVAAATVAAWYALPGLPAANRIALAVGGAIVASGAAWSFLNSAWPLSLLGSEGAMVFYVLAPLVLLVLAGVMFVRSAGERPPRLLLSWVAALVALVAAYPLALQAVIMAGGDDMSELIVIVVPAMALFIWMGPFVGVLLGLLFLRPVEREGSPEAAS
jgi:hypothetical protein